MVHGFLYSNGVSVAQRRVGSSLARVSSNYQHDRPNRMEQQTNPIPYEAEYFDVSKG